MPPRVPLVPIKYAAILKHVQEVTLTGTADLNFWKNRLQQQNLLPAEQDGRARVMVIAAAGRFAGITFREVSFSILLSGADVGERGAYLLGAFNSVRFFAFLLLPILLIVWGMRRRDPLFLFLSGLMLLSSGYLETWAGAKNGHLVLYWLGAFFFLGLRALQIDSTQLR